MKPTKKNIVYMLKESNVIEGVYDDPSLARSILAWQFMMENDVVNSRLVKTTHYILMQDQDLEDKYKGKWRDVPVWIGGIKKDDPPLVINSKIDQWCVLMNESKLSSIYLHVMFEKIHPFIDGNGRMGRLLMNWREVKMGGDLIVYTEAKRHDYYKIFQES